MQSFASSIVASLVLGVLLYASPTEAACTTTALIAPGTINANYVSVIGNNAASDCATADTQNIKCSVAAALTATKYCAVSCKPGAITVKDGAVGSVGEQVSLPVFLQTKANHWAKTAGTAGVLAHGDCTTVGKQVEFIAFTTVVPDTKYAKVPGSVGTVSNAGVLTAAGKDVEFAACSTCESYQDVTTACKIGTVAVTGALTVTGDTIKCSADWANCASVDGSAVTTAKCKCGTNGCAIGDKCTSASNKCLSPSKAPTKAPTAVASGAAGMSTVSTAACVVAAVAAALPLRN